MINRRGIVFVVVAILAIVTLVWRTAPSESKPGALAIETRLLAPCCWNGTLDTHESELAHSLRHEIETRVEQGEASDRIEADLVSRYGVKMRALPHEAALQWMLGGAVLFLVAAGAFIASRMRRWRRSNEEDGSEPARSAPRVADAYDARIDAELADLD